MKNKYDKWEPWPCGAIPEKWKRPEINQLKEKGYKLKDMEIVETFEEKISKFTGSEYGVAINGCTNAIFLSLMYLKHIGELFEEDTITIPKRTYVSPAMTIINNGFNLKFEDLKWKGQYQLKDTRVWDSATRFTENMFIGGDRLQCISFQSRKRLPIGRGGMVITNDKHAADWLRKARIDGRDVSKHQFDDEYTFSGWNLYMTPDDAARGILIFDDMTKDKKEFADYGSWEMYPDLSTKEFFEGYENG